MPITIDIEKDYLYKLGLKKAEDIIKEAKESAKKQVAKAKAEFEAKAEAEKARAKAEKARAEAKAQAEKAKIEAEKKIGIQKLQIKNKFSDEEIMEILSLDKKAYERYIKEISEKSKK